MEINAILFRLKMMHKFESFHVQFKTHVELNFNEIRINAFHLGT